MSALEEIKNTINGMQYPNGKIKVVCYSSNALSIQTIFSFEALDPLPKVASINPHLDLYYATLIDTNIRVITANIKNKQKACLNEREMLRAISRQIGGNIIHFIDRRGGYANARASLVFKWWKYYVGYAATHDDLLEDLLKLSKYIWYSEVNVAGDKQIMLVINKLMQKYEERYKWKM